MARQKTVAAPVQLTGVGLHTGEDAQVEICPAPANHGIVFVRSDLPSTPRVPASVRHVVELPRRTAVAHNGTEVHTVEHVMATFLAMGITNAEVRLDGPELPGLDGSALPYVEAIRATGVEEQDAAAREIRPRFPVAVEDGGASVVAIGSSRGLTVSYTLYYDSPYVPTQYLSLDVTEESFTSEIAPARTFVLEEEARHLQLAGLGKGANTQNTLVLGENGVIDNKLRFPDEFVRHKILDLIGDLYLAGGSLQAHVTATKSGHALNWQLARSLADQGGKNRGAASSQGLGDDVPENTTDPLDIRVIEKVLPHRYPFLLIDRILEVRDGRYAKGLKNVSINEEFFQGHFPNRRLMPGVLQLEAMAQLAGIMLLSRPEYKGRMAYLLSMDKVKFRRGVVPGDQLIIEVDLAILRARSVEIRARAFVETALAAEATIRLMLVEND